VNANPRIGYAIAVTVVFLTASILSASKPRDPATGRKAPPTLKEVDAAPANYLGQSLQLTGWLAPNTRSVGTGAELSVSVDTKSPASRVRFLVPNSLAAALAEFKEPRHVRIAGSIIAAESVRTDFIFEVDEIAILNADDTVMATLKPAAGPLPTVEPVEQDAASNRNERDPIKPAEPAKKSGVPTVLIVGAALMAALLVVLSVIGVRLLKYMKAKPRSTRKSAGNAVVGTANSA
jgi:hypothetical protein